MQKSQGSQFITSGYLIGQRDDVGLSQLRHRLHEGGGGEGGHVRRREGHHSAQDGPGAADAGHAAPNGIRHSARGTTELLPGLGKWNKLSALHPLSWKLHAMGYTKDQLLKLILFPSTDYYLFDEQINQIKGCVSSFF